MSNFQFSPGRVLLQDVFIRKQDGTKSDITPMVSEINIDCSLLDVTTTVRLFVNDDLSLLTAISIEAGDTVEVNLKYASDVVRTYNVFVIKIGDIVNGQSGRAYTVTCVSEFMFNSLKTKISRSVAGNPAEISQELLQEFTEEKIGVWQTANSIKKYILPYQRPSQAIKFLAENSLSNDNTHMHFYQDSKMKYNFTSIENLIEMQSQDAHLNFVYNANTLNLNTEMELRQIENLVYNEISDFPFHTNKMSNSSTCITTNITSKEFDIVTHNYWRDFEDHVHLNKNPLYSSVEMDNTAQIKSKMVASKQQTNVPSNSFADKTSLKKTMVSACHSIDIIVQSNESLDVGMVVDITIPKPSPHTKEDDGIDKMWSGKYLVFAKREVIRNDEGRVALTLIKDSKK